MMLICFIGQTADSEQPGKEILTFNVYFYCVNFLDQSDFKLALSDSAGIAIWNTYYYLNCVRISRGTR